MTPATFVLVLNHRVYRGITEDQIDTIAAALEAKAEHVAFVHGGVQHTVPIADISVGWYQQQEQELDHDTVGEGEHDSSAADAQPT
jgi:hypothetical protein